MNDRSAVSSESSSRYGSPSGASESSGVRTSAADRVEKLPGSRTSCENPDVGGWHEAGPAAGLLARRWALEVLRVLNERLRDETAFEFTKGALNEAFVEEDEGVIWAYPKHTCQIFRQFRW